MSRLLIVGASVLQLPAIKKAKELGHFVAVADFNPEAVGVSFADEFYNVSTIDEDGICQVAAKMKPDGIMTLATDMPIRSIAKATEKLGLPGITYSTALKATDKGLMIEAFKEYDVPSPWFHVINSIDELQKKELSFPCIIKPTDNAGSRGVILVESKESLLASFIYSQQQSRKGYVIVEEYMQGPEVSVEVLVVNNVVHVLAITDKLTTGAPNFVEMGHHQPSSLDLSIQDEIVCVTKKAIQSVGITNGPAHVEIIVTKDGPKMVELGARMGGDCITTHLVPLSTGIDMIKATIDVSLGISPMIKGGLNKGAAIRYIQSSEGVISNIIGVDDAIRLDGVKDYFINKSVGDKICNVQSSIDRIGAIITQGENAEEAINIANSALNLIKIRLE